MDGRSLSAARPCTPGMDLAWTLEHPQDLAQRRSTWGSLLLQDGLATAAWQAAGRQGAGRSRASRVLPVPLPGIQQPQGPFGGILPLCPSPATGASWGTAGPRWPAGLVQPCIDAAAGGGRLQGRWRPPVPWGTVPGLCRGDGVPLLQGQSLASAGAMASPCPLGTVAGSCRGDGVPLPRGTVPGRCRTQRTKCGFLPATCQPLSRINSLKKKKSINADRL